MKTVFSFFATILFSANGFSQSSAEVTCRARAKEMAVQTYATCITEERTSKVEEIRKSYQKELADLKAKYDTELKKMAGPKALPKAAPAPAPKPVKGVAQTLPKKTPSNTEPAPVQNVSEGTKVVTVNMSEAPETAEGFEEDSSEAGQPEMIEMPVE